MRRRTGDWRDLLSAYELAFGFKQLYAGLCAVAATVFVFWLFSTLYTVLVAGSSGPIVLHAMPWGGTEGALLPEFLAGGGLKVACDYLPLLNPIGGGLVHLLLSGLFYVALFAVWSGPAGVISRLAALKYGRDDLPTLREAREMLAGRRKDYLMAPTWPLIFIFGLLFLNILGGLVAAVVPWVGRLLFIPGVLMMVVVTALAVFLAFFGVLAFGMMFPAVSASGKDAFESFCTCYAYAWWGLRRLIGLTVVAAAVGVVSTFVVGFLAEATISIIDTTVGIGFFRETAWITNDGGTLAPAGGGVISGFASLCVLAVLLLVRLLPAAYAFSYFFAAYTVIFLLMRKDQDNIEIDEIYEEADEEEGAFEEPELDDAEAEAEAEPEAGAEPEAEGEAPTQPADEPESESESEDDSDAETSAEGTDEEPE